MPAFDFCSGNFKSFNHRGSQGKTSMLNWIVIGVGDITTRRVIPAIQAEPRSQLYGIVTRDPAKAAPFADRVWTSLDEALADSSVQAVYVGTPVFLHAPQTIYRSARWQACIVREADGHERTGSALHGRRRRREQEDFWRRLLPALVSESFARERVAVRPEPSANRCLRNSPIISGSTAREPERNWLIDPAKAGGGPLWDIASHRIDVLNFLFGQPKRVCGQLGNAVHHYAVEDNATVMIEYEGGVRGVVDVRWHSR